jgi:hypothetical protein
MISSYQAVLTPDVPRVRIAIETWNILHMFLQIAILRLCKIQTVHEAKFIACNFS